MLQSMRGLAQSWIFKGLMILLIVSFGIWGIGDIFHGNPKTKTVAQVGPVKITVEELEKEFIASIPDARAALGKDLTEQKLRQMGVLERTLKLMIEKAKFTLEAQRAGLYVSDKMVIQDLIRTEPRFIDKKGNFSLELWQKVLAKGNFTEKDFFKYQQAEIARQIYLKSIGGDHYTPDLMATELYKAMGQQKVLEVVEVRATEMPQPKQPDEAQLENYYKNHEEKFSVPEMRAVTVATLNAENLKNNITVTESDIRSAYESRTEALTFPEQRDVLQAVVQDEESAKKLATAAAEGKFAETAKKMNINLITLKRMDEQTILPELYASVFSLKETQTAGPLKSPLGYHVVQVLKIHPAGKVSFDEIKDELHKQLLSEKQADVLSKTLNNLDDELAAGKSIDDLADTYKLSIIKIPALDAKGETAEHKAAYEQPLDENVKKYAFDLSSGETSPIIESKNGLYFIIRTDSITPAHTAPFENIKKLVQTEYTVEEKNLAAQKQAESIADKMREGKAATSFATLPGVNIKISKPLTLLGGNDKSLPASINNVASKMQKNDVFTTDTGSIYYAVRVADILPAPSGPEKNTEMMAGQIKTHKLFEKQLPLDFLAQYSDELTKRYPTEIYQSVLNNLKNRGS